MKKVWCLLLAAALWFVVMGAVPVMAVDETGSTTEFVRNLLGNGGFETADALGFPVGWNSPGTNLVPNGGFEDAEPAWTANGGLQAVDLSHTGDAHSGSKSAKLVLNGNTSWGAQVYQNVSGIHITSTVPYVFRMFVKTSGMEQLDSTDKGAQLAVTTYNPEVNPSAPWNDSTNLIWGNPALTAATTENWADWQMIEETRTFGTRSGNPSKLLGQIAGRVGVGADRAAGITVLYDDLSIEKQGRTDTSTAATGTRSLKVVGYDDADGAGECWTSDRVSIPAEADVRFSVNYKTEAIAGPAKLIVRFYSECGSKISEKTFELEDASDWTHFSGQTTSPMTTTHAELEVCIPEGTGTAWFDDAALGVYDESLLIGDPVFNLSDLFGHCGETLTTTCTVYNTMQEAAEVTLVTALYDGGNRLVDVRVNAETLPSSVDAQTLQTSLPIPDLANPSDIQNYKVKVLLWDSLASLRPLREAVVFPEQSSTFSVNAIFQDHMVLQREKPIPVYGTGTPGEPITVTLGEGAPVSGAVDADGTWRVELPALPASKEPTVLTVTGRGRTLTFDDILIGDVWVISGQSNAARRLDLTTWNDNKENEPANDMLRLLTMADGDANGPTAPQTEIPAGTVWTSYDPATSAEFSAVGYYFGREINRELDIPLGLIKAAIGGTRIERWFTPELVPEVNNVQPTCVLYNRMIAPLTQSPVKGVIWYQGEANSGAADIYDEQLRSLIQGWRDKWGQGADLNFLICQLAGYNPDSYALIRDAQLAVTEETENCELVQTIDVGDEFDVHPTDKETVGVRAANIALDKWYGKPNAAYGPTFQTMAIEDGSLLLTFDNVGDGIKTSDGGAPKGFFIADDDYRFYLADAELIGTNQIRISSDRVSNPTQARYAFFGYPYPDEANCYGSNDMPMLPFRTDDCAYAFDVDMVTRWAVDGGELVANGDFELVDESNVIAHFTTRNNNGALSLLTGNDACDGNYAIGITNSVDEWCGFVGNSDNNPIRVEPGTYQLSMDVKTDMSAPDTFFTVSFSLHDKYGNILTAPFVANGEAVDGGAALQWNANNVMNKLMMPIITTGTTDGYVHQEMTFEVPEGGAYLYALTPRMQITGAGGQPQSFWLDNLSLRKQP